MSTSYVDEYLVKLGASVDASGMQRFYQALREATAVADTSAASIAGAFFKAQTEIVGGFAAIGSAAIGMVDKVAMADQSYRLFALHMYMSKENARGLKVAMDALGASLEDMTWDKELRERTHQLIMDQRAMAPDGDFEGQMRKVRDIRFEFTRMEVEGQYLAMHVVQNFLTALGLGPDTLLAKLRGFNDWVTTHMPQIANTITTVFMPVWRDVEMVGVATGRALAATAVAFTNLVGLFTGDSSIEGTTFNLEKFGGALVHIVNGFAIFATAIANVEELLAHLVSALALLAHGNITGAGNELGAAFSSITAKAVGGVAGGWAGGAAAGALAGSALGPVGTVLGGAGGALGGAFLGSNIADKVFGSSSVSSPEWSPSGANPGISALIDRYASGFGINAALAHALAHVESGERQYDAHGNLITSSTGAIGVMQLTRATAKALGVDRNDTMGNIGGGMALFGHLLKQYGDAPTAIAAYHEGEPKMNAILAGKAVLSPEARAEVASVMRSAGASGDVHVGSIVIHIDKKNATNEDVGNVVVARLQGMQNKRVQRNLAEFQDPSWSY